MRWLGIKPGESWRIFGWIFTLFAAIGVAIPLALNVPLTGDAFSRALPLLPVAILLAGMNAFTEEINYRASMLSTLVDVVGKNQALLLACVFFGLAHWLYSLAITAFSFVLFTLFGAIRWDFSGQVFLDSLAQQFSATGEDMIASLQEGFTPQMMFWLFVIGGLTVFNTLPLAFVLPLTFWSNLGVREVKHRTGQIIFSAPHPLTSQLSTTWFTGVLIAFIITSPIFLHLIFTSQWSALGGLFSGILFVPTLALTLGIWSNGSKFFEGGYLFLWYIASMYSLPALDFMGRVHLALQQEISFIYNLMTLLILTIAYRGRRRQVVK